jgi:hypothetical protein
MSDLFLVLGLVCTFGAILLLGFALDGVQGERNRAVRLLESQVAGSDVNMCGREMEESLPACWCPCSRAARTPGASRR